MEEDEPLDPLNVGLLGSQAVVLHTDSIVHLIEESRLVEHKVEVYKKIRAMTPVKIVGRWKFGDLWRCLRLTPRMWRLVRHHLGDLLQLDRQR